MNNAKRFLDILFQDFERKNILFCVLHSYETLPEYAPSDIDITIDPTHRNHLDKLLIHAAYAAGFCLIQKLYYDIPYCYYYVLVKSKEFAVIKLDFLADDKGLNRYYLPSHRLLKERVGYKNFYVPAFGIQVVYLLIKKAIKEKFLEEHFNKIKDLFNQNPQEVSGAINKYFKSDLGEEIIKALNVGNMGRIVSLIPDLQEAIEEEFRSKWIIKKIWGIKRIFSRCVKPTGILIGILSPDGGGKSSVSKATSEKLLGCFRKNVNLHWRPCFLPQLRMLFRKNKFENEVAISNPHSTKKRNVISSFLRWLYYSFDYVIGYYLKILPMKIRTTAVVMERYYYDVIVDPVRYGFNLPRWLLRSILPLIPKPDLTIYLENKPEELYRRKQELPLAELKRQVEEWRQLIPVLPNARIVTTDKPLDEVSQEVASLVLARRTEMTRKMLKIEPAASKYLWKSGQGYIALPCKRDCRWIMPTSKKAFGRSWDLYRPYSLKGKAYKNIQKALFFVNSLNEKKIIKGDSLDSEISANLRTMLAEIFKRDDILMAISTGTQSPFRKTTGLVMTSGGDPLAIIKIAETEHTIKRVMHEVYSLKTLANMDFKDIRTPNCYFAGDIGDAYVLVQSFAPFEGVQGGPEIDGKYLNIIRLLVEKTATDLSFDASLFYGAIKAGIESYPMSYKGLLRTAFEKVKGELGGRKFTAGLSHGDFAPWNMLWRGKEVFLYDWESTSPEAPSGIDLVHFSFQTGFLLKKLRANKLLEHVNTILASQEVSDTLKDGIAPDLLFLSYLLHMAVHEDREDLLSVSSVERRKLLSLLSK